LRNQKNDYKVRDLRLSKTKKIIKKYETKVSIQLESNNENP